MTDRPDPLLQAARAILRGHRDAMRDAVQGLAPEAINWAPAGEDTNSIAVLVHHAWHSTRQWLAIAVDAPLPERNRPAEFEVSYESSDELVAKIEEISDECLALISREARIDPGAVRRHWDPDVDITVNAAWALMHALEHLGEHLGHIGLTCQLWETGATAARR